MIELKERVFSGVQPTGNLTLGNSGHAGNVSTHLSAPVVADDFDGTLQIKSFLSINPYVSQHAVQESITLRTCNRQVLRE